MLNLARLLARLLHSRVLLERSGSLLHGDAGRLPGAYWPSSLGTDLGAWWPLSHTDRGLVRIAWVVLRVECSCWSIDGERLLEMWRCGDVVGGHRPLLLLLLLLLLGCSLLGGLLLRMSCCLSGVLLRDELLLVQTLLLRLLLRLLQSLRLRLRLGKMLIVRVEHLLLPLLLYHGLLLSHGQRGEAGLGADDAHVVRRVLHGHARLARLAGLLHEVIVWMGHGWRRVCRTRKRRLGQGHGFERQGL
jgi:hypothetical protein